MAEPHQQAAVGRLILISLEQRKRSIGMHRTRPGGKEKEDRGGDGGPDGFYALYKKNTFLDRQTLRLQCLHSGQESPDFITL